MEGKVKFFNEKKGYGFIEEIDGNDLFFHVTSVENKEVLQKDDKVRYVKVEGDRGWKADNIMKL